MRCVPVAGLSGTSTTAVGADELAEQSDLLVSLGGDGTMLRAMRMVWGGRTPVLGVNLGRLGFLAEIDVPLPTPPSTSGRSANCDSVAPPSLISPGAEIFSLKLSVNRPVRP